MKYISRLSPITLVISVQKSSTYLAVLDHILFSQFTYTMTNGCVNTLKIDEGTCRRILLHLCDAIFCGRLLTIALFHCGDYVQSFRCVAFVG